MHKLIQVITNHLYIVRIRVFMLLIIFIIPFKQIVLSIFQIANKMLLYVSLIAVYVDTYKY